MLTELLETSEGEKWELSMATEDENREKMSGAGKMDG